MTESIKPQKVELHSQREILTSNRNKRDKMVKAFQHIRGIQSLEHVDGTGLTLSHIRGSSVVKPHFRTSSKKETR